MKSAENRFDLPQGTVDLLIMRVVALGPIHGYSIAQNTRSFSRPNGSPPRLAAAPSPAFPASSESLPSFSPPTAGLLSYSVARRTSELGIRLALGAQSRTLLWMVVRESLLLLSIGVAIGVPVAITSTRILKSMLYQLSPLDPTAMSVAITAVAVMTIGAAWLPARRATKIDPLQALRTE